MPYMPILRTYALQVRSAPVRARARGARGRTRAREGRARSRVCAHARWLQGLRAEVTDRGGGVGHQIAVKSRYIAVNRRYSCACAVYRAVRCAQTLRASGATWPSRRLRRQR
jgi:hypothetical protein